MWGWCVISPPNPFESEVWGWTWEVPTSASHHHLLSCIPFKQGCRACHWTPMIAGELMHHLLSPGWKISFTFSAASSTHWQGNQSPLTWFLWAGVEDLLLTFPMITIWQRNLNAMCFLPGGKWKSRSLLGLTNTSTCFVRHEEGVDSQLSSQHSKNHRVHINFSLFCLK